MEVVKLLANQGDFDSQLKLRNLSVEWLKLLAFRGDKSSMRKYGSYLLDKESKPGGQSGRFLLGFICIGIRRSR